VSRAERFPGAARAALEQRHAAIIVTSAEAIRTLDALGPANAPWHAEPLFAVGEATASAARASGFESVFAGDGDGGALVDLILEKRDAWSTVGSRLLYLAGTPRAALLERRLKQAGITFDTCECYRVRAEAPTVEIQRQVLETEPVDAVLLYSAESARRFLALALLRQKPELLERFTLSCISSSVAEVLPSALRRNIKIAARPQEHALLATLSPATE
jgi:uroporphyrinogen-III synthase